jgi:Pyridoxamine 5'-phosphate oxidase
MPKQGDVSLLNDPVAQQLLQSTIPARLAYNWTDGTPRVVPIWFHYDGKQIVMGTPSKAPKLKALGKNARVALTIDGDEFPHKVLLIRGAASVTMMDGIVPEYAAAAGRYFGTEQGKAWCDNLANLGVTRMGRIAVTPDWVGVLDFQTRFPSAVSP